MGTANGSGHYWTAEGYFIEDLFASVAESPIYADTHLVVTRTTAPAGLRFAGEIDMTNSSAIADSLRIALADNGTPHLDLSRLSFCDISGIRAIIDAAHDLEGGRILLHGLPLQLQTVMKVTGWAALPNLGLCACGGDGE